MTNKISKNLSSQRLGSNELFRLTSLALLLLLFLAVWSCEKKSTHENAKLRALKPIGAINVEQTRLATIPEEYDAWDKITFSADGRQVFYQAAKKDGQFIVVASTGGESIGPAYDGVSYLVSTSDGQSFAYGGGGRKKRLVINNKEMGSLKHEVVAPGAFSPDGRFVVSEVGGFKEKQWFIVVSDGENEIFRSPGYPDTWRQPVFSPDGRLLVYVLGEDKRKFENKKDAKKTVFFLDVPDRKVIKEWFYTENQPGRFSFSSDSSRVLFDLQKEGKNLLVLHDFSVNAERTVELPYPSAGQFALSPDGKQVLSMVTKAGKQFLAVSPWETPAQGKMKGPYDAIDSPVFGPDSKTAIFLAMKNGKWREVVGDKEGPAYDGIGASPVFSPDGAKMAYPAMKGIGGRNPDGMFVTEKWFMVVAPAGTPAAAAESQAYDMAVTPVFSPDGKYIAFRARKGSMEKARRFMVIVDAKTGKLIKEGKIGDEIWPPVWSADSKLVGHGARQGRELWWKVQTLP